MSVRRVVTGHVEGKAVFVADGDIDAVEAVVPPNTEAHKIFRLWGADVVLELPDQGESPVTETMFPPVGGFRALRVVVPPGDGRRVTGPDDPGMHTTDTVDVVVILSGELHLELDDGAETRLRGGDVVVQNGTRHRWSNRSDEPATYVAFLVGAERTSRSE
jgi:quercetin dioxygenase-like cupin family protein